MKALYSFFLYIIVIGRAGSAKTLVLDTFMIILHSSLVPYLESKSYCKYKNYLTSINN